MEKTYKSEIVAPVAQLKARLSEYLRLVKAGQEVLVTERGRPIARVVPVSDAAAAAGRVQQLVAGGVVREPRRRRTPDFWKRTRPADPQGRSLRILLEERAEDR